MATRQQNERRFRHWIDLPNGGRQYWLEVPGHSGWMARYIKVVDKDEITERFWQEIYDDQGNLQEMHQKFPVDMGHRKA